MTMTEEAPPTVFHNAKEDTTRMRCRVCQRKQPKFHCTDCLRAGDFVHYSMFVKETFFEKKLRYENQRNAQKILHDRAEVLLKPRIEMENLNYEIPEVKRRIAWLKAAIKVRKENIAWCKQRLPELRQTNSHEEDTVSKFRNIVRDIKDKVDIQEREILAAREKNSQLRAIFKKLVREKITCLTRDIFPIHHIPNDHNNAEMTRTIYSHGSWIVHPSHGGNYRIVAPYLPANGDYKVYKDWVMAARAEDTLNTHEQQVMEQQNRTLAALQFTTQFLSNVSYYLDIRLPFILGAEDFTGGSDMPEQKFNANVMKLNANVLYLAYMQNANLNRLKNPLATLEILHNLFVRRSIGQLGYNGAVDAMNCLDSEEMEKLFGHLPALDEPEGSQLSHDDWEEISHNVVPIEVVAPQQTSMQLTAQSITKSVTSSVTNFFSRLTK